MRVTAIIAIALTLGGGVFAQSSRSYRISGWPIAEAGSAPAVRSFESSGYSLSMAAVGESVGALGLSSPSYAVFAGTVARFPVAGEVVHLRALQDRITFAWDLDESADTYRVYRGLIHQLPGAFGACRLGDQAVPYATLPEVPDAAAGEAGFFYLVTAVSRLREEGTKGAGSAGIPRANPAPCP